MKRLMIIVFALSMLGIYGCSPKTIDASSEDKLEKSINAIKSTLDGERKAEFEKALQAIVALGIGNIFDAIKSPESIQSNIADILDGKTAEEIIAEGNRILLERKKKENEQIKTEIDEINAKLVKLDSKRKTAEEAAAQLKQFRVIRSRFYYTKYEYQYIEHPIIELTVKNNTSFAVSRAYFSGTLSTPGRAVPWVQEDFNYKISGGLEPGEEATWKLSPDRFDWNAPKERNDMVLTVTVERIDGPEGKAIYDSKFPEHEQKTEERLRERLEALKRKLAAIENE